MSTHAYETTLGQEETPAQGSTPTQETTRTYETTPAQETKRQIVHMFAVIPYAEEDLISLKNMVPWSEERRQEFDRIMVAVAERNGIKTDVINSYKDRVGNIVDTAMSFFSTPGQYITVCEIDSLKTSALRDGLCKMFVSPQPRLNADNNLVEDRIVWTLDSHDPLNHAYTFNLRREVIKGRILGDVPANKIRIQMMEIVIATIKQEAFKENNNISFPEYTHMRLVKEVAELREKLELDETGAGSQIKDPSVKWAETIITNDNRIRELERSIWEREMSYTESALTPNGLNNDPMISGLEGEGKNLNTEFFMSNS